MKTTIITIAVLAIFTLASPILGSNNDTSEQSKIAEDSTQKANLESLNIKSVIFSQYPSLGKIPIMRGRAIPCTTLIIIEIPQSETSEENPKPLT